jgi:hypothetical protein
LGQERWRYFAIQFRRCGRHSSITISTIELDRPVWAKRMHHKCSARDEVSPIWLHHCNLLLPASIRMCVRSSTSGISRDEVSMSRFSFSHLQRLQQFIVDSQQLLEGIVVDHHAGSLRYFFRAAKRTSYSAWSCYCANLTDHSRW